MALLASGPISASAKAAPWRTLAIGSFKASVKAALEAGGEIVGGLTDAQGNLVVHVKPGDLDALPLKPQLFVNANMGFTLEYFGPGSEQMYHDWFKDDYATMI